MSNRGGLIVVTVLLLILSVWAVSSLLTLRDEAIQYALIGVGIGVMLLFTIKPTLPVDFKMVLFVLLGYFVAGKGFAYLSPAPPVYIGELALGCCVIGYLIRSEFNVFAGLRSHYLITFMACCLFLGGAYMCFNYLEYGMWAIRDYSMIYYSLFMVLGAYLLSNLEYRKIFEKYFLVFLMIGSGVYVLSDLIGIGHAAYFAPHADIGAPLLAAGTIVSGRLFVTKRSLLWGGITVLFLATIFTNKTAFPFSFILASAFLIVFAQEKSLWTLLAMSVMLIIIIIPLDLALNFGLMDKIAASDLGGTVSDLAEVSADDSFGESGGGGTSGWRLGWWKSVYELAMSENPVFGLGFGADITTPFLKEFYGIVDIHPQHHGYARYPHSILFTVFGRMGIVGVLFFLIFIMLMLRLLISKAAQLRSSPSLIELAVLAFVVAGVCNAFVQATYETPFAAIPHWIALGYLVSQRKISQDEEIDLGVDEVK